jgi:hypothetical protein
MEYFHPPNIPPYVPNGLDGSDALPYPVKIVNPFAFNIKSVASVVIEVSALDILLPPLPPLTVIQLKLPIPSVLNT